MGTVSLETPIGRLVAEQPSLSRIFERLGIDYCCAGRPLADVCDEQGLDPETVLNDLLAIAIAPDTGRDWSDASLTELCDHIEETHHAYMRESLRRLTILIDNVCEQHGGEDQRLEDAQALYMGFRPALESHIFREEVLLFPLCRRMEVGPACRKPPCGSFDYPIRMLVAEHKGAGENLVKLRALTGGFTPPEDACNTYRVMLQALEELEADMRQYINLENDILFPKAIAAEAEMAKPRGERHATSIGLHHCSTH